MGFKLVEKKANGTAVISTLETEFSGFVGIEPEGSEEARMYAASPDYASHCVFVPDPSMPGYQWSLEHIEEVCHFPQEPNDRGDAASQAINYFRAHADGFGDWTEGGEGRDRRGEKGDRPSGEFY
jgi:predicted phage terminase large subunit-like protein